MSCIVLDQTVRCDLFTTLERTVWWNIANASNHVIYILYDFTNIYKHEQLIDLCFIQLTNILSTNNHVIIFYNSTNTEFMLLIDYFSFMFNYTNTLWPLEYRICKFKKSCDFWSMWGQTPNFPCWKNGLLITWLYICDRHVWCEISIQDSWNLRNMTFFDITNVAYQGENVAKTNYFQRIFQYSWTCDHFKL